jgi:hypothetical protein
MMARFLFVWEGFACRGGAGGRGAVLDAPQFAQNFAPTGNSVPHLEQYGKLSHKSIGSVIPQLTVVSHRRRILGLRQH